MEAVRIYVEAYPHIHIETQRKPPIKKTLAKIYPNNSGREVQVFLLIFTVVPCVLILSKFFIHQLMHK
jgi:hypothetical protein